MTANELKGIIQDGVPILGDVIDIHVVDSVGDCQNLLRQGATLLSVATKDGSFVFLLGWRRSAGEAPPLWKNRYDEPTLG
jgi:hypothetical protein